MNTFVTSDQELVARFAAERDEEAFAELVRRHWRMVQGVCRRTLVHAEDAEDAFQAAFLVLAKDAARIRRRSSLASWLYGVAYRTAKRALAQRRRRREQPLEEATAMTRTNTLDDVAQRFELQLVDDELHALPARYRAPLVLRYLAGRSYDEIAVELGVSLTTVQGRLKRGKRELRLRLVRRGVGMASVLAAVAASPSVAEATVEPLISATAQASLAFVRDASSAAFSSSAGQLAIEELSAMTIPSTYVWTSLAGLLFVASLFAPNWGTPSRGENGTPPTLAAWADGLQEADEPELVLIAQTPKNEKPPEPLKTTPKIDVPLKKELPSEAAGTPSPPIQFTAQRDTEKKIVAALAKPTAFQFDDKKLADVFAALADMHRINIHIDRKKLEDAGINPDDVTVTRNISGVSLRSALGLVLEQLGLDYIVKHEVLVITSKDDADQYVDARVYDIRRLRGMEVDALSKVIQSTIVPHSWAKQGGPGEIASLPGALVIMQTQRVHQQIVDLFTALERHAQATSPEAPRGTR